MRPWKIVLTAFIAASGVVAALLQRELAAGGLMLLLLHRLPALALTWVAVYALAAVVATAGGLIGAAVHQRRILGRINAFGQTAALDWIAAFDASPLRALLPRPASAPLKSAGRGTAILLGSRFDLREARAEAAHLFYIWLARTHALGALAGIAALAAVGFAQQESGASFLQERIPMGAAVVVVVGLLMLILLARYAIDVTVEPLIEAMSRLPWEQEDSGRLRYAVALLESARLEAGTSSRSFAGELPQQLAVALEDSHRTLDAIGERLSTAADRLGAATRSASDALDRILRETRSLARGDPGARGAALQAAVEALTAELREGAAAGRDVGATDGDRRALAEAVERLSAAADAVGAAARSSNDALAAALREITERSAAEPAPGAASLEALRAGVDALTARVQQLTAVFAGTGAAPSAAADLAAGRAATGLELQKLLAEI